MRASLFASAFLSGVVAFPAAAADAVMSPQGYSGLSITPTADLLRWGDMSLTYDSQLPGARNPEGHNFVAGFGLLPFMEVSGRIASNIMHCNLYTHPECGIRDLSASVKAGIGFGEDKRYRIAVGGTDLGGIVTFFRSYYGVGTYDSGSVQYSLGIAKRADARSGGQSPLHGAFGSIAYQPLSWLQGHLEHSDGLTWVGTRVFTPEGWLPRGWRIHAGVNLRLTDSNATERTWWSVGMTIPLHHVPTLPARVSGGAVVTFADVPAEADMQGSRVGAAGLAATAARTSSIAGNPLESELANLEPSRSSRSDSPAVPTAVAVPEPRASFEFSRALQAIARQMQAQGLEDVSVGRLRDGGLAVDVNNATYNWNLLDVIGVALGVIGRESAATPLAYRLIVRQRQTPIVAVSGRTDCLSKWIEGVESDCPAVQLHTPGTGPLERLHEGVGWEVRDAGASWRTVRLGLEPVLNSNVATEYGVLDYSVGLGLNLQQPLWDGASIDIRHVAPLADSSDFETTGPYAARRLKEGVDRALISQTLRLPLERWLAWLAPQDGTTGLAAVTAHASVGKINRVYNGVYGNLRWEPGRGAHRFGVEGGYFKHKDKQVGPVYGPTFIEPRTARPVLGSYRYQLLPTETNLEITAGRFVNHDTGVQLALRQWFGDKAVALFYKRTRFDYQQEPASFVGIELTLPLGPRRDMLPGSLMQVRGVSRWGYGVQTLTGGDDNRITTGHAVRPGVDALNETFNSDRAGLGYFNGNLRRIRQAASATQ